MKTTKKNWRTWIGIILIFAFFSQITAPMAYAADTMTDIRIGLTKFYKDKSTIRIKTTKIGMGYSMNDSYTAETTFTSANGFMFQPTYGWYYILDKSYSTYDAAYKAAAQISALGVKAYPAAIYRKMYTVYVGNCDTESALSNVYKKIKGKLGFTYQKSADNSHRLLMTFDGGTLLIDGNTKQSYPQFKALVANSRGAYVLDLGSRQYRGRIEIGCYGKSLLTAVNILNVESYLYGVVPSEMSSTWPKESLRAQAVCSRSYAVATASYGTDSNISKAYTIQDTTYNQVYKGYSVETAVTNAAVNATKGQMVYYNKKLVPAYYFSTSGGRTESSYDVWGNRTPYYQSVVDEFETEPELGPWIIAMSKTELAQKMSEAGYSVGKVTKVSPMIYTQSDRVYSLKITGSLRTKILLKQTIRSVLDLYSTKFDVVSSDDQPSKVTVLSANGTSETDLNKCYAINGNNAITALKSTDSRVYVIKSENNLTALSKTVPEDKDVFYFVGMGYGHGIGMSQSGAKGLAKQGYTYKEIIEYYFKGCRVS